MFDSLLAGGVNDTSTFYNNFTKKQSKEVVESILDGSHEGKTVLICWEHTLEVDIANRLGIPVEGDALLKPRSSQVHSSL